MQYRRSKADSFSAYTANTTKANYTPCVQSKAFQFDEEKISLLSENRNLPERNFRKVAPTTVRGFTVNYSKDIIVSEPLIISKRYSMQNSVFIPITVGKWILEAIYLLQGQASE